MGATYGLGFSRTLPFDYSADQKIAGVKLFAEQTKIPPFYECIDGIVYEFKRSGGQCAVKEVKGEKAEKISTRWTLGGSISYDDWLMLSNIEVFVPKYSAAQRTVKAGDRSIILGDAYTHAHEMRIFIRDRYRWVYEKEGSMERILTGLNKPDAILQFPGSTLEDDHRYYEQILAALYAASNHKLLLTVSN